MLFLEMFTKLLKAWKELGYTVKEIHLLVLILICFFAYKMFPEVGNNINQIKENKASLVKIEEISEEVFKVTLYDYIEKSKQYKTKRKIKGREAAGKFYQRKCREGNFKDKSIFILCYNL